MRTLGTGSFGRVVLARRKDAGAIHAVKILTKAAVVKLKQIEHTLNEKSLLQCIGSPFCVALLDSFKDNDCLYMSLEV